MKKGWIIAISVILAVIVLIVILSFTVFSLKSVEVDFRTNKIYITATDEEIIESGEFDYGGSVFFKNKDKYIDKIERANPYVKVVNIEVKFPSKYIIHIAERQEVFAVEHNGLFYICDEDFKVLRIADEFSSDQTNAMLVTGLNMLGTSYAVGEFMNVQGYLPIYSALYENNRPLGDQVSIIESIEFTSIYDDNINVEQEAIILNFFNGQTYKIINANYGLVYKTELMLDVFSQIFNFIGKEYNGAIITEENLRNVTVEIRNYYDYRVYGEEDCYFTLIFNN